MKDFRSVVGMVLFLFAVGFVVNLSCGCSPAETLTVENAAAVAQFDAALVECKRKAKAAKDFDVYDECEQALAKHYCSESPALRKHWPICKEVLP